MNNDNGKQQKIHIPASLKNKRKRKTSHRDIANLIHLQRNPEIIKRHQQQQQQNKRRKGGNLQKQRPREDFITMYLVSCSLYDLIKATTLFITLLDHIDDDTEYTDSSFSNTTPIHIIQNGIECEMSFKCYYNMIYESAMEKYKEQQLKSIKKNIVNEEDMIEKEQEHVDSVVYNKDHVMNLLRACFLIAFFYDERIKRFVMSNHSIHSEYLFTKPPDIEKIKIYIQEAGIVIDSYLFHKEIDILQMSEQCISMWIRTSML